MTNSYFILDTQEVKTTGPLIGASLPRVLACVW